jgi:GTPase SAR1 family protein
MQLKELITQLANKYGYDNISQRLVALPNAPTIRIGFIGEFSAGKSSLINSILDIHLPTNIAPTTKAICLIEPTVGLESNRYFKERGNVRETTDFTDFRNILRGESDYQAAVVQVPPCEVLPSGCIFVDTPGIHTATGSEAELTKAYLSMLDAAVVCINITNGVINKDLLDFLCDAQLKHLQKHLVFALTWSDRKSPEEGEIVRKHIVQLLQKTVQEGRMDMDNLDAKVFTISALEQGNAEKLYKVLKHAVLEDLPALHEQRKQQMLKGIGKELLAMLQERLKVSQFNDSELDSELENTQKEMKGLQIELRKREGQMDTLQENVTQKVQNILSNHLFGIGAASSPAERVPLLETMNQEITQTLQAEAKTYLGINNFSSAGIGNIGQEIETKMQSIEAFRNMSVTISTALATAWLIPGGAVVGNIAQAAGGAAVQGAASAVSGGGLLVLRASNNRQVHSGHCLVELGLPSKPLTRSSTLETWLP